jgi:ABC transport system ATP-binding/permease protein
MPLTTLDHVSMAFGHLPLLDDVSCAVDAGERVAVIGRNGAGKSTLLRVLGGELEPDAGSIWRAPAFRASRLVQDASVVGDGTVFDLVAEGLGDLSALLIAYHQAARAVAEEASVDRLAALGRLHHALEEGDGWRVEQKVETVLTRLGLDAEARVETLSGGWRRRVLLARALVSEPSLLLLDEPTNHLDIEAIEWLESFLEGYPGALVFVTHDRAFLQRLATRIIELDRGRLTSWPGDYETFLEKKKAWLADESRAEAKFDKRLTQEEAWIRRGVKARRTRDEGRVRALMAMRQARAARRAGVGAVRLQMDAAERSGTLVFEALHVTKRFGETVVVREFSTRVMRGDRVGLIGPNGSGKTTLLRLLIGELAPDEGEIVTGANVQVAYFDQQREQLDPDRTVVETLADGNDMVTIGGRTRHVHGYLEDFLFPPERARSPVGSLSGGERNRLLLARLLTRPANVLVLDEPTNDLDIETLELVEAQLASWSGTLLVVSHDRTFLDHVVTSTLVFEGGGAVQEYVGGYADWLRQRPAPASPEVPARPGPGPRRTAADQAGVPAGRKLSFRERREFDALPARIEALEAEDARLSAEVAGVEFYKAPADRIRATLARLDALRVELEDAYRRWDELDSRAG